MDFLKELQKFLLHMAKILRSLELSTPVHMSCMSGIHNSIGVKVALREGAERMVFDTKFSQAEIENLVKCNTGILFEIIASGGICLFDCYRCRLPHEIHEGNYKTMCSRSMKTLKSKATIHAYRDFSDINIDLPWYLDKGIYFCKIEGRTRPPGHISKCIEKLKNTALEHSTPSTYTCDPYKMCSRVRTIDHKNRNEFSEITNSRVDVCEIIEQLFHNGIIDHKTNFWCFPFPATFSCGNMNGWTGSIINDLMGPPFLPVDSARRKMQWASPLYTFQSSLDETLSRMEEMAKHPNVQSLRIHDIGLLDYANDLQKEYPVEIVWDRFGWPARNAVPLPMLENFLSRSGVQIKEYGAYQNYRNEIQPEAPYMILVLPGSLAAMVPPSVNYFDTDDTVFFDGSEK